MQTFDLRSSKDVQISSQWSSDISIGAREWQDVFPVSPRDEAPTVTPLRYPPHLRPITPQSRILGRMDTNGNLSFVDCRAVAAQVISLSSSFLNKGWQWPRRDCKVLATEFDAYLCRMENTIWPNHYNPWVSHGIAGTYGDRHMPNEWPPGWATWLLGQTEIKRMSIILIRRRSNR